MSCLARAERPCANAVRARNDGAKPTLTRANAPFLRKILREIISSHPCRSRSLKFRRAEGERRHMRRSHRLRYRTPRRLRDLVAQHHPRERLTVDRRPATVDDDAWQLVARERQRKI